MAGVVRRRCHMARKTVPSVLSLGAAGALVLE
jgi:hypothetical protein